MHEYNKKLRNLLIPYIFNIINKIFNESQRLSNSTKNFKAFQLGLKGVANWDKYLLEKIVLETIKNSRK